VIIDEELCSYKAIAFTKSKKKSRVEILKRKMYITLRTFLQIESFLEKYVFSHKLAEIVLRKVVIQYG